MADVFISYKSEERAFAQSNMVEKLPDTQRAQAAALKAKQEAINDLRKQYAAALDQRTVESNASLRALEGQVSSISAKMRSGLMPSSLVLPRQMTRVRQRSGTAALRVRSGA